VVKNKVAPPFRQAEFDIFFDGGISREADLLDLAVDSGVLARAGTWYSYGQMRLGQGRENARQFLCDNPDVFNELRAKVVAVRCPVLAQPAGAESEPESSPEERVGKAPAPPASKRPGRPAVAATSRKQ
jgi:recombination protein RecA